MLLRTFMTLARTFMANIHLHWRESRQCEVGWGDIRGLGSILCWGRILREHVEWY